MSSMIRGHSMKTKARHDSTTGVRNLSWHKSTNRWRVRFRVGRKEVYCRMFHRERYAEALACVEKQRLVYGKKEEL